jgi:hypothetical protein
LIAHGFVQLLAELFNGGILPLIQWQFHLLDMQKR